MERTISRPRQGFYQGRQGNRRRVLGSPDIYSRARKNAKKIINFVTYHDGYTLNDLVSYNQKHNDANGEENREGANDNNSWNMGAEGPTDSPEINELRE